jgi:predicted DNA-binding protein
MKKVTTLRLAPEILERLQIKAKEQGTNPSNYIRKMSLQKVA